MNLHQAINYLTTTRASYFGIDPNTVIVGGGSLGAATALQATFASKTEIAALSASWSTYINNTYFNEYNINNVQSKIKGVMSFFGGLYNIDFIGATDNIPAFLYHGNIDPYVPYNKGYFMYNTINTEPYIYGSGEIAKRMDLNNQSYCFVTAMNLGHTFVGCNYQMGNFPIGYPMNYWPEMLTFLKGSVLCQRPNKVQKTIDCIVANNCDATAPAACRVAQETSVANSSPNNTIPVVTSTLPMAVCQPTVTNEHCHAFSFDGGDYVKVPTSASLNFGIPTNIDFWFKKNGIIPSNKINILYSAGIDLNVNNSRLTIGLIGENQLWVYAKDPISGNTSTQTISIPILDANWHHFAFVLLSNNVKFFIDATGTATQYNANLTITPNINNSTNFFGGTPYILGSTPLPIIGFKGQMDNIRYYVDIPDAFGLGTDAYVLQTKNSNVCPNDGLLKGYWKLNQDGQSVKDETSNHNDGLKGLGGAVDAADPTYVSNCNTSARMANPNNGINNTTQNNVDENKAIIPFDEKEVLNIFPNPTNDKPNVLFISKLDGLGTLEIVNENSTSILNTKISLKKGLNILTSYLPKLPSGFYIFKVQSTTDSFTQKIIITK